MRTSIPRITAMAILGLLVVACTPAAGPITSAVGAASAPPGSPSTAATPSATPGPTGIAIASPSLPPPPATGTLPVRGSGEDIGRQVQMHPGPTGGLYVYITTDRGSTVALLDTSGAPRPGWPIALDGTYCDLPTPAADGSIRVVCGVNSEPVGVAYAFAPDARPLAGWPVELPSASDSTVVGTDLYTLAYDDGNARTRRLVVVASDGTVRTGARFETPDFTYQDSTVQLGPDGTAYLFAYPNTSAGDTEISAIDLNGIREGWRIHVKGRPSGLAFGRGGRIYVTEGVDGARPSRVLAFDRDGQVLPVGSDELPVVATSAYSGAGPFGGAPPPVVAEGGTTFLVCEDDGTTVFGLDDTGRVLAGWPYRDTIGLEWSYVAPGETGSSSWRADPAVGPGAVLYLLHPPREPNTGGSVVAIGSDGKVRPGWPVALTHPRATFRSVVVGPDGTAFALAVEPEGADRSSATILAVAPDSTIRYRTTIVEP